jgi:hypothetical protein
MKVCINPIKTAPGCECLIAHILPKWAYEPSRTVFAHNLCAYFAMKKKTDLIETTRTTVASVKKEMQMPRLTESVRNDKKYQATLGAERVGGVGNSPSQGKVSGRAAIRKLDISLI